MMIPLHDGRPTGDDDEAPLVKPSDLHYLKRKPDK